MLDTNFSIIKEISLRDVIKIRSKRKFKPFTYKIKVPIDHLRSWGGRKLNSDENPFVAALEGRSPTEMLCKYNDKINSIRDYNGLIEDNFCISLFNSQRYPWDPSVSCAHSIKKWKVTIQKELGITVDQPDMMKNKLLVDSELKRLSKIYLGLSKHGYDEKIKDFTPIRANLLKLNDRFIFLIRHGEHGVSCFPKCEIKEANILVRSNDIIEVNKNSQTQTNIFELVYSGRLAEAPLVNVYGFFFI